MAKPEWGMKRLCGGCGCRFYDMSRNPVTCPKCGSALDTEPPVRSRRSTAAVVEPKPVAQAVPMPLDDEAALVDVDDEALAALEDDDGLDADADAVDEDDEALMEDASDLGEDDDDMAEVMEHMDEEGEDEA